MDWLVAVIVLTVFVMAFGGLLLFLSAKIGPRHVVSSDAKMMAYECGIPGQEAKDTKISVRFYLTAILFILFDIEIIFMYPWALAYNDFFAAGYGAYILLSMMFFLAIFIVGLVWEIKSKALEWE